MSCSFSIPDKYKVEIVPYTDSIQVRVVKAHQKGGFMICTEHAINVSPPGWWDKLWDTTYLEKVEKARDKCQVICDLMNRQNRQTQRVADIASKGIPEPKDTPMGEFLKDMAKHGPCYRAVICAVQSAIAQK